MDGLRFRYNSLGYLVMELDYWADPAKAKPEWAQRERKKFHEKQWRREMGRDWSTSSGDAFYPEFQIAPARYTQEIDGLVAGAPVVRGYDLGFRAPVCVFMQASRVGRIAVLREIVLKDISAHNFRDLVKYCSGEVELEYLYEHGRTRALHWLDRMVKNKLPEPPWFAPGTRFVDYASPECYAVRSIEGEASERNDYEVFAAGGIVFGVLATRIKAREEVIRRLLGVLPDGKAGIIFDPVGAPDCIRMMNGGLAYKRATKMNPLPTEPAKDGFFDNIHDALGYGLVNIAPVVDNQSREEPMEPETAPSGRQVGVRHVDGESLDMSIDW